MTPIISIACTKFYTEDQCDLDLRSVDLTTTREHLWVMINLHTKFEEPKTEYSLSYGADKP